VTDIARSSACPKWSTSKTQIILVNPRPVFQHRSSLGVQPTLNMVSKSFSLPFNGTMKTSKYSRVRSSYLDVDTVWSFCHSYTDRFRDTIFCFNPILTLYSLGVYQYNSLHGATSDWRPHDYKMVSIFLLTIRLIFYDDLNHSN
jgi:hypothetical protein